MKKKVLALTTINNTVTLKKAIEEIHSEYGPIVEVKKIYFDEYESNDIPLDPILKEIEQSDIILVDIRGDIRIGRELPRLLKDKNNKTIVVLVAGTQKLFALTKMGKFSGEKIFNRERDKPFDIHAYIKAKRISEITKKLGKVIPFGMLKDMRNWILCQEYYAEGDAENLKNLLLFLLKNYAKVKKIKSVPPPKKYPPYGLVVPESSIPVFYNNLKKYKKIMKFRDDKPTIGVLLYAGMHFADTQPIAKAIYDYMSEEVNFIFVAANVEYNIIAVNKFLRNVDLLLNLQYFRIHGGPYGGEPEPTYAFLKETNVPMLIGLRSYETTIEQWKKDKKGLNPLEIVLGITLPELDGAIEPIFVAGLEASQDQTLGEIKRIKVLEERIAKLCERIKRWLILQKKPNTEKRIAIITYNYPPGEENLASAGYLDVFESLKVFLEKLKERGYNIKEAIPDVKELFLSAGLVNSPNYIKKMGVRISIQKYKEWFSKLPTCVQEEVIRYWGNPPGEIMVEKREILIPVVTLGNILLGVQPSRGVHEDPEKAYHDKDLPPHHQYLAFYMYLENEFHADAIIHFGMHGTLEFTKGKEVALSSECYPDLLIGNTPHLYYYWIGNTSESTIAKRRSYALCISHASPPMKTSELYEKYLILEDLLNQYEEEKNDETLKLILDLASELHFPLNISEIRKELYKMKRRLIPYGLHIMDQKLTNEQLVDYLIGVLRIDREYPSIFKMLAREEGYEWEQVKDSRIGDELLKKARKIIKEVLKGKNPEQLPRGYADFVRKIRDDIIQSKESENLLKALEGKYVLPARGGDPIRDPQVYPSGRAMYAFDPRAIPTVVAEIRGKAAAEGLLKAYKEKHGHYPESVGIVLWGFETMKTGGDTIATILSLMGVKIKHTQSSWIKELEIIPLEELKRPRIDVLITICGIFRDTFGVHIDLINRAIELVAKLDEPVEKNFVRKHYLEKRKQYGELALSRIFGPSPTEYATSVRTLIETGEWETEQKIVNEYVDSMNYAYFRGKIEKQEEIFTALLEKVDLVTQERDNTEYEVTDLDHYYEFLGGLSRAVQEKKGMQPDIAVVDSTEDEIVVEDLAIAIERSTRTRILNPKWIEGMLKHDYHGAKKIKDRVEYLLGFAATTRKVSNWVFEEVANKLILNTEIRKKLQENNPYATAKMVELLIEAEKRGYWNTTEKVKEMLQNIMLSIEGEIE